jgi:hypothetical protein
MTPDIRPLRSPSSSDRYGSPVLAERISRERRANSESTFDPSLRSVMYCSFIMRLHRMLYRVLVPTEVSSTGLTSGWSHWTTMGTTHAPKNRSI